MRGLLPDINIAGDVRYLVRRIEQSTWSDIWSYLNVTVESFKKLGLNLDDSDLVLWHACQANNLVFVTANRNDDGPNSLATAIRDFNKPRSLPVLTLANPNRLRKSKQYADKVTERLLDILLYIDDYRGTGRVYLP